MKWVCFLFLIGSATASHEFTVNLKDPEYRDGVITTDQGGVITSEGLRIQAQEVEYVNNGRENRLTARGNLMVDNGERIFVGKSLTYDFKTRSGIIEEGRTQVDIYFLGGTAIALKEDHSFSIDEAFVTTSESLQREWEIHSHQVTISHKGLLEAKDVTFRIGNAPVFYIPYFKNNLRSKGESPVRYNVDWESGQGPRFSMRYKVYSWKTSDLYFRLDYRLKRGWGGAVETDSHSLDKRTSFQTKSYVAHDTFYNDNNPDKKMTRYRLQGHFQTKSRDEKTGAYFVYDKFSDRNMPSDFKPDSFELSTAKETRFVLRHLNEKAIFGLNLRPRINPFQGFMQEMPALLYDIHPFQLGRTGIITDHRFTAAYLNYVYANDVSPTLSPFSALRLSYTNSFYRPCTAGGFTLTPSLGMLGIAYSDSPKGDAVGQAILNYGVHATYPLQRIYSSFRHNLTPYVTYTGLTHPTVSPDHTYIFSILDGYHHLNLVRFGIHNALYTTSLTPRLSVDLYALAYKNGVPKTQLNLSWNYPTVRLFSEIGYNNIERSFDYTNAGIAWTISAEAALSVELRHRGKYWYKKNDHDNYILEVTRTTAELLDSPLSDGRNTLLTRLELRPAPNWICQFQAHQGWGRKNMRGYNEVKLDLFHVVSSRWKVRVSYMHTVRTDQVTAGISLVK